MLHPQSPGFGADIAHSPCTNRIGMLKQLQDQTGSYQSGVLAVERQRPERLPEETMTLE